MPKKFVEKQLGGTVKVVTTEIVQTQDEYHVRFTVEPTATIDGVNIRFPNARFVVKTEYLAAPSLRLNEREPTQWKAMLDEFRCRFRRSEDPDAFIPLAELYKLYEKAGGVCGGREMAAYYRDTWPEFIQETKPFRVGLLGMELIPFDELADMLENDDLTFG